MNITVDVSDANTTATAPLSITPTSPTSPTSPSSAATESYFSFSSLLRTLSRTLTVHRYLSASVAILCYCYTQVLYACISFLQCATVGSASLLFSAPTIDCESDQYRNYRKVAIAIIVVYGAGLPISIAAMITAARKRQFIAQQQNLSVPAEGKPISGPADTTTGLAPASQPQQDAISLLPAVPSSSLAVPQPRRPFRRVDTMMRMEFFSHWGFLFSMYHTAGTYGMISILWQPLTLIRRVIFVSVTVATTQQPTIQFFAFTVLNLGTLLIQVIIKPYNTDTINLFATITYAALALLSSLLGAYQPPYSDGVQVCIILIVCIPALVLLIFIGNGQVKKRRIKR